MLNVRPYTPALQKLAAKFDCGNSYLNQFLRSPDALDAALGRRDDLSRVSPARLANSVPLRLADTADWQWPAPGPSRCTWIVAARHEISPSCRTRPGRGPSVTAVLLRRPLHLACDA